MPHMHIGLLVDGFADVLYNMLFFNIFFWSKTLYFPFLIAWLMSGAIYCNYAYRVKNLRYIAKAVMLIFSTEENKKQINERRKADLKQETSKSIIFTTIGSSIDIASMFGVILAIKNCGIGVLFWVLFGGFAATSIRFSEAFLGHRYRVISADGTHYTGGPQIYIKQIFKRHFAKFGLGLALFYNLAMACSILPSPQLNQAINVSIHFFPSIANHRALFSLVLCIFVIGVTIGGFRRISTIIPKLVIAIACFYAIFSSIVIFINFEYLPHLLKEIITDAFTLKAGLGGLFVTIATGLQRSFYSTEAGMGVAGIAHANSINKNSVHEGMFATIAPIFSAIFLCISSGVVTCLTGAQAIGSTDIEIMILSCKSLWGSLHYILLIIIPLSGMCTAINWAYYGISSFSNMSGGRFIALYVLVIFICYYTSCMITDFSVVLKLADISNLSMGIPNLIAIFCATQFIKAHLHHKTKKKRILKLKDSI